MAKNRYFEWIAGENIGEVAKLETIEIIEGETIYNFDNGESCNLRYISKMTDNRGDLREKFVVEVESPSNVWTTEIIQPRKYMDEASKEQYDVPSLHDMLQAKGSMPEIENSDIGKTRLIPPRNPQRMIDLPKIEDYPVVKTPKQKPAQIETKVQAEPKVQVESKSPVEFQIKEDFVEDKHKPVHSAHMEYNPVKILVDSCKKHETSVSLDIKIMLPSRYIYNIAANEFDNGGEKFIDCVVSDIDPTKIIASLRKALKDSYSDPVENQSAEK